MTICEIIKDMPMSTSFSTNWLSAEYDPFAKGKFSERAVAVQIVWKAVGGTLNGTVKIYGTNLLGSESEFSSTTINLPDNSANSILVPLSQNYRYWKLSYLKNGILSGTMSAVIVYSERY